MGRTHGGESVADGIGFGLGEGEQEMLGGDEVVLEGIGFLGGAVQNLLQGGGHCGLRVGAGDLGQLGDGGVGSGKKLLHADARAFEDGQDDALAVVEQGGEQVHGQDFRVAVLGGQGRGGLNGLLRLDGQLLPLEWHDISLDADGRRADIVRALRVRSNAIWNQYRTRCGSRLRGETPSTSSGQALRRAHVRLWGIRLGLGRMAIDPGGWLGEGVVEGLEEGGFVAAGGGASQRQDSFYADFFGVEIGGE